MEKFYDLEKRTFEFAKQCRDFLSHIPKTQANTEYARQLIRSSASQAANYIEANEALSKKDFRHRIKICRKETKESGLWLKLLELNCIDYLESQRDMLMQETIELRKIFTTIENKARIIEKVI